MSCSKLGQLGWYWRMDINGSFSETREDGMCIQHRMIIAMCGITIAAAIVLCSAFLFAADPPGPSPMAQEPTPGTATRQDDAAEIQERAIRQGTSSLGESQCVCERPLGQCVVNSFGCVPHPGNPCNGGCVMKQSNLSVAPAARNPGALTAPAETMTPGTATR